MGVLPEIIGLPPRDVNTDITSRYGNLREYNQPLIVVQPREPILDIGMVAIKSTDGTERYQKILSSYGIQMRSKRLKFAALNEGSISDDISNSYGASFLGSSVSFFGSNQFSNLYSLMKRNPALDKYSKQIEAKMKNIATNARDVISKALDNNASQTQSLGGVFDSITSLAMGLRIDLADIWQGSSASSSYSFTVRLYNTNPKDDNAYLKNIIEPLIAILSLVAPVSEDGIFYDRPFIARIEAPGMYLVKEAAITGVSITKGGDANDYTYEQRPNLVDIRLSFQSLYPAMVNVVGKGGVTESFHASTEISQEVINQFGMYTYHQDLTMVGPPTVNDYVNNLMQTKSSLGLIPKFNQANAKKNMTNPEQAKDHDRNDVTDDVLPDPEILDLL